MPLFWSLLQGSECCCLSLYSPFPLVTISCLPQGKPAKILQEVFLFLSKEGLLATRSPEAAYSQSLYVWLSSLGPLFGLHSRGKGNQGIAVRIHRASLTEHEHSTGAISAFPGSSASQRNTWLNNIVFFLYQKFITCITLLNFCFSLHKSRESMLMLKNRRKKNLTLLKIQLTEPTLAGCVLIQKNTYVTLSRADHLWLTTIGSTS